ncbi:MAG: flotillin family protein [Verrucomicrobia bacterium]|nr:flotillin family protein [Verrucomicrobiota bacterium]
MTIAFIIQIVLWIFGAGVVFVSGYILLRLVVGWTFRIPTQGQALVRTGLGGTKMSVNGMIILPIVHKLEYLDVSVKRVEIHRHGANGLICKDNLRADIKVTFYIRVDSKNEDHVRHVAQTLGCQRGSDEAILAQLFEPKFSDALKTAGRDFDFVDLLNKRADFREAIKRHVGTDLNGYVLDDAAIDHLEQTPVEMLDIDNILDSEGIKKITERTAQQKILTNEFNRNCERDLNQKNVETRELILEQNRQLAEAEQKQKREVASITAREESETLKVQQEGHLKAEKARIATEEEVQVAEQNKERQIIVALKNKERTNAVETVRVEKDRQLEDIERERIVTLTGIEKEKAVEVEKKNIQDVIRQRVTVQKAVVEEEQKIKDTEAFFTADRAKRVTVTAAEADADQQVIRNIKAAEASKKAAELKAEQEMFTQVKAAEAAKRAAELHAQKEVIEAQGEHSAAAELASAKKKLAEGITAENAAGGLAEAQVTEARAAANQKQGTAEATVMRLKFEADADGILRKAEAMKQFNAVGREHEEFKIQLTVEKDLALAEIGIRKDIAMAQAGVVGEALKSAKIDIVGGETEFFNKIVNAVTGGKVVDRVVDNSRTLSAVRDTFFDPSDPGYFRNQLKKWVDQFGLTSEDLRNLTITAAVSQMIPLAPNVSMRTALQRFKKWAEGAGLGGKLLGEVVSEEPTGKK